MGLVQRTLGDLAKLVPYTIIMVIPMSPPGHVFAFSVLNRVFPGAVPSAFTAQRQDINDIYARIAAEASNQPRHLRLLLRFRRLKSLALQSNRLEAVPDCISSSHSILHTPSSSRSRSCPARPRV